MNLLEVKNICKTYGSGETAVQALKNVSFSVPRGEYVAVVGESGSGKSTLLNMIGALDTPTSGHVIIDGKDIFSMDDRKLTVFRRRNIGFIFQSFNLVPELTVEQNIMFPMLLDYQKPDKKYLEELLTVLNLKDRRNHGSDKARFFLDQLTFAAFINYLHLFHIRYLSPYKCRLLHAFFTLSSDLSTTFTFPIVPKKPMFYKSGIRRQKSEILRKEV